MPARRPAPAADGVTARASQAAARAAPPEVIEAPAAGSSAEPSAVDIPVDLASFVSSTIPVELASSVGSAVAETRALRGNEEDIPVDIASVPPPRPLLKRRAVLLGAACAVIALVVIAFAKGSRPTSAESRRTRLQSSSTQWEQRSAASSAVAAANELARPRTAQPIANPVTAAASASAVEAAEDVIKIAINVKPDGSSLYYKGRVVGRTPFILKQPRGERRSYEAGKHGYTTRRVVVTGNERSIGFELELDTPHPDSL